MSERAKFDWVGFIMVLLLLVTMACLAVFAAEQNKKQPAPQIKVNTEKVLAEQIFPGERCQPAFTPEEESGECRCTVRIQKVKKVGNDLRTTIVTVFSVESEPCSPPAVAACESQ